jgi:hypothetical protein
MLPAFLMPALIGGGAGLLFNRKDPLKGALMGAGIGAAGGLLGPAAGAAEAAAPSMTNGAFLGEGVASGVPAWEAAPTGGLLSGLKTAGQAVKPVADAAGMAQKAGLLDQEQPMQAPPPMIQPGGGPQSLTQLAQMRNPTQGFESAQQERRQRRRGILGMA